MVSRRVFILASVALLLLEGSTSIAQGNYSVLVGSVKGMRARIWLDVESETDKAVVNFRVGRKTVYVPHRFPVAGEKVKVEYLTQRGIPVAYTVTVLEAPKEVPKESRKEVPKESSK